MKHIDQLFAGYRIFYQKYFVDQPDMYHTLVSEGQSPKTLVIACSDSRVDPSTVLNTEPGDIFVIRNVANLVPPYDPHPDQGHHGTSAALEFAVRFLNVESILVLGHHYCGGVSRLLQHSEDDEKTFIDQWVDLVASVKEKITDLPENEKLETAEKEVIKLSIENLMTFPFVQKRVKNKTLSLHGWFLNIETGALEKICLVDYHSDWRTFQSPAVRW